MDLKELTAFHTIIQEGTFAKAAFKLNYAQSTITNQIQRLEKELGIQLFKRGWEAELTDAGRIFALEVERLIQHWNYAGEQARALQQDEIGTITIGAIESLTGHVLPAALRKFKEHKPRMACQLLIGNTDTLSQGILQQKLHFAVCGEPADLSAFQFEPLYYEKIAFVVPDGHSLAHQDNLSFQDLLHYPVVAGGQTCLYSRRWNQQLARYPESPVTYTVSQISSIPGFARELDAVGVVLGSTDLPEGMVRIDPGMPDASIPVGLLRLRKEDYQPASRTLLMECIREALRD